MNKRKKDFLYRNMSKEAKIVPVTIVDRQTKVIAIQGNMSTSTSFTASIKLAFTPREVIVRQVTYKASVAETYSYLLYSDLNSGYLASFIDGTSSAPGTCVSLGNFANNTFNFWVYEALGVLSTHAAGLLNVILEFRE